MKNRLTPSEESLFEAARKWFVYRTPENTRRLVYAVRDWIRSEERKAA